MKFSLNMLLYRMHYGGYDSSKSYEDSKDNKNMAENDEKVMLEMDSVSPKVEHLSSKHLIPMGDTEDCSIRRILRYTGQTSIHSDCCYIMCVDDPKELVDSFQMAVILKDTKGFLVGNPEEVLDIILFLQNQMILMNEWEMELASNVYRKDRMDELLAGATNVFPYGYAIVDRNLRLIYTNDPYHRSAYYADGTITMELAQSLLSNKVFHEVAKRKDSFLYYLDTSESYCYCRNLFLDDEYAARLILMLPEDQQELPLGLENFFGAFADRLQDALSYRNIFTLQRVNDDMHRLCRQMMTGKTEEKDRMEEILSEYGWRIDDTYSSMWIHFESPEMWNPHMELTLEYLILELERKLDDVCAFSLKQDVCLILHYPKEKRKEFEGRYYQQIAYFVRENLCKAGIGCTFRDFRMLSQAVKTAEAALRIGSMKNPHTWTYVFEDYRLSYMLDHVASSLPTSMLIHPALHTLMEYDLEHNTSLLATLRAYLVNNLNMTQAADALYIHRTSFCRRMSLIEKITGLDLKDADLILTLLLSFKLMV